MDEVDLAAYIEAQKPPPEPETTGVKARVYGPVVGEHYRDANFGPTGNALGPNDVALSPDLLKRYPLGSTIYSEGKPYKVSDVSYINPDRPNRNTIEFRDTANPPSRVSISPTPTPGPQRPAAPEPSPAPDERVPDVVHRPLSDAEIENLLPSSQDKTEEQASAGRAGAAPQIPQPTPIALPEIPPTSQFPMAQIDTAPAPPVAPIPATPIPDLGIQQAIQEQPQQALIAGPPTAASLQDVDLGAYIAANQRPSPTPTPAPAGGDIDLGQYIAANTSRSELLPPVLSDPGTPSELQKIGRAFVDYGREMIPTAPSSVQEAAQQALQQGALQAAYHAIPGALAIPEVQHVRSRAEQVRQAELTPPFSQERHTAGIATVLDLAQAAAGAKAGARFAARAKTLPRGNVAPVQPVPEGVTIPQEVGSVPLKPVPGSGKFRATYQIDKEMGDLMENIGAAKESGFLKGEIAFRKVTAGLSKEQIDKLGKYLVSRRLLTLNEEHPQILPPEQMRAIESDPAVLHALGTYVAEVKPEVEALRMQAGLTPEAAAGKEAEFISLIPTGEELAKGTGMAQRGARLSRTTKFAREAKGFYPKYSTDLKEILGVSYSEVMRKALVQKLYDTAAAKGFGLNQLPEDIANNLRAATERPLQPSGLYAGIRKFQRAMTSTALTANPAELVNHMRRQLDLVSAVPPVGHPIARLLEPLLPYFGPKLGSAIRAITADFSKPDKMRVLQDIFDAGGGSSRSFYQTYAGLSKGPVGKYTGMQWLQHKTHNLLFGIPRGKGVQGWDLRMRVALEETRRATEGNVDPQRIREFSNQIGQYGSHPDWIIAKMREINPYAATTLPLRWTEMKQILGGSGLKDTSLAGRAGMRLETFLRGTGGTMIALATANYLLSGKWPWDNDPGHELDLNTGQRGKDGREIYLKSRIISPEVARPLATLGAPNLLRERTAKHPQYGSAVGTAAANTIASLINSPGLSFLTTATTGKVLYVTKSPGGTPEVMDVTGKLKPDQSRLWAQSYHALSGLNPIGTLFIEEPYKPEAEGALKYIEEPIPGIRPLGASIYTESYEKKRRSTGFKPVTHHMRKRK